MQVRNIEVWQANLRRDEVNCTGGTKHLVLRGRYQRNNTWTKASRMALLDTILMGYPCAPIYLIASKKAEDVFDGAHRLETVCDFVTNKFPIQKATSDVINWESSQISAYVNLYYKDLPDEVQEIFRNYTFTTSTIPNDVVEDPERLSTLWIRLNNSGKPLNDYEKYIPVYYTLYKFLEEHSPVWFGTCVYASDTSDDGKAEVQLMRMFALSEVTIPTKFSSQNDIYKKWRLETFGKTTDVDSNFEAKKSDLETRLKHLRVVYGVLEKHKLFEDKKPNDIVLLVLISRIARWCDTRQMLTRCESRLIEYATMMFNVARSEMASMLCCPERNGGYQTRLIYRIDRDIHDIVEQLDDPRLFTPTQKTLKLREQCNECPWCKKPIEWEQKYEGHHVVPYSKGGPTTLANLQVLHEECHKALHLNS
jgi:hypothetical protein